MPNKDPKTVYVALSGGVDSSVAALLLQKEGYNVVGVYMKTWSPPGIPCTSKQDRLHAMRVCAKLKIPFKTWDFRKDYKKEVVDYMISEYGAGRTPNPDVMCNKVIKFGLFFKRAIAEGADYVATGHYAQIKNGAFYRGKDTNKDQTYFLWTLTGEHLEKTLFPIGSFTTKEEVREIATKAGLPTASKKDSQGVCFVGPIDMGEFLRNHITKNPGPIVTTSGREVGRHQGLAFYTIGQRGGINVGGTGPYYVAKKEAATNTLVVVPPAMQSEIMFASTKLKDVNIISPLDSGSVEVVTRYRQSPIKASITIEGTDATINFAIPVRAITPGQSAVFYQGDKLIGGGVIK